MVTGGGGQVPGTHPISRGWGENPIDDLKTVFFRHRHEESGVRGSSRVGSACSTRYLPPGNGTVLVRFRAALHSMYTLQASRINAHGENRRLIFQQRAPDEIRLGFITRPGASRTRFNFRAASSRRPAPPAPAPDYRPWQARHRCSTVMAGVNSSAFASWPASDSSKSTAPLTSPAAIPVPPGCRCLPRYNSSRHRHSSTRSRPRYPELSTTPGSSRWRHLLMHADFLLPQFAGRDFQREVHCSRYLHRLGIGCPLAAP